MTRILENKLELAKERKASMRNERVMKKSKDEIEYFKNHYVVREETRLRNIKIFEMNEQIKRDNIKVIFRYFI